MEEEEASKPHCHQANTTRLRYSCRRTWSIIVYDSYRPIESMRIKTKREAECEATIPFITEKPALLVA